MERSVSGEVQRNLRSITAGHHGVTPKVDPKSRPRETGRGLQSPIKADSPFGHAESPPAASVEATDPAGQVIGPAGGSSVAVHARTIFDRLHPVLGQSLIDPPLRHVESRLGTGEGCEAPA